MHEGAVGFILTAPFMYSLTIKNAGPKGVGVFARKAFAKGEPVYHEFNNKSVSLISLTNHSCSPNCEVQLLLVVARKPIAVDEEITLNYHQIGFFQIPLEFDCHCGSPICEEHIKISSGGPTSTTQKKEVNEAKHCNNIEESGDHSTSIQATS